MSSKTSLLPFSNKVPLTGESANKTLTQIYSRASKKRSETQVTFTV